MEQLASLPDGCLAAVRKLGCTHGLDEEAFVAHLIRLCPNVQSFSTNGYTSRRVIISSSGCSGLLPLERVSATLRSLDVTYMPKGTASGIRRNLRAALRSLPQLQCLNLGIREAALAEQQEAAQALIVALRVLTALTELKLAFEGDFAPRALPLGGCQGLRRLGWDTDWDVPGLISALRTAGRLTALTCLEIRTL